jgi:hypothetical protein
VSLGDARTCQGRDRPHRAPWLARRPRRVVVPVTRDRALVIGGRPTRRRAPRGDHRARRADLVSPLAGEVFARYAPGPAAPVDAVRRLSSGSRPAPRLRSARGRGALPDAFGWALGEYMWSVVADAAGPSAAGPPGSTLDPGRACVTSSASGACGARAPS